MLQGVAVGEVYYRYFYLYLSYFPFLPTQSRLVHFIRSEAWRAIACGAPGPPAARHSPEGGAPAGRHAHGQWHSSPLGATCVLKVRKAQDLWHALTEALPPLKEIGPGSRSPLEVAEQPSARRTHPSSGAAALPRGDVQPAARRRQRLGEVRSTAAVVVAVMPRRSWWRGQSGSLLPRGSDKAGGCLLLCRRPASGGAQQQPKQHRAREPPRAACTPEPPPPLPAHPHEGRTRMPRHLAGKVFTYLLADGLATRPAPRRGTPRAVLRGPSGRSSALEPRGPPCAGGRAPGAASGRFCCCQYHGFGPCYATSGGSPGLALRGSPASTWTRESVSSTHGSCERLYAAAHAKARVSGSADACCITRLHMRAMSTAGSPTSRRLATQESTQHTVVESCAASAASASSASRRTASDCSGIGMTRNVALPGCAASFSASWWTAARRESSECPAANLLGSQVGAGIATTERGMVCWWQAFSCVGGTIVNTAAAPCWHTSRKCAAVETKGLCGGFRSTSKNACSWRCLDRAVRSAWPSARSCPLWPRA